MAQELHCNAQLYAWGKLGSNSKVAQLSVDKVDEEQTYAELWMGTHPKGPSLLKNSSKTLSQYIEENKENAVGAKCFSEHGSSLPFLFKVLSVNKALSIQAHPDLDLAKILHEKDPEHYLDDNHKPEMVIALTEFEGLCGFRPLSELHSFMLSYDEFAAILGSDKVETFGRSLSDNLDSQKAALKECFSCLMRAENDNVTKQLIKLIEKLKIKECRNTMEELIIRTYNQYPNDVGVFCIFFLNYVVLNPGDALFLKPNLPHAYLAGDSVEVMACSDNVVRAGCTPKFKDVDVLCDMLTYEFGDAKTQIFRGEPKANNASISTYDPPIKEFTIDKIEIKENEQTSLTLEKYEGPSILLCVNGNMTVENPAPSSVEKIFAGSILFIPYNTELNLRASSNGFTAFRAYCIL